MRKMLKNLILTVLLLALLTGLLPVMTLAAADTAALGQLWDSFAPNSQTFTLTAASRFYVVSSTEPAGELLQTVRLIQRQFAADAMALTLAWGDEQYVRGGDIVLSLDSGIAAEGYKLVVADTARVTAGDCDGLLYGANALHKHLRYAGSSAIQGFTAQNEPDTRQRAVSLDCGRKYFTKDWICNFIREMSWMGYNTLELHFSDDSGFRMDFWDPAYYTDGYQPKNDFTWLCGSNYTSWTLSAYKNDPDKGKFLTTAEVIEILNTAKEYHIDVIPAFDSPSHLDYTTWMYEQNYKANPNYSFYSTYNGKTYYAKDVSGCINYTGSSGWSTALRWPYYSAVNIAGEQAKAFIFELYIDIANFFKTYAGSTDFSIGADEVNLSTSNLASGYKFAWGFPEFVGYINELNTLLGSKGYTMRMYNDFLGSISHKGADYDFAGDIEILYWDSPFNPSSKTASNHTQPVSFYVNQGRTLYNCIQTGTYYALRVTSSGSDARSKSNRQWTFYHSNETDIYNEWYPADISEKGDYSENVADVPDANLGGAYFLIWCDYASVSTEIQMWNGVTDSKTGEFYSLRNRMWSNATKMWNWDVNSTLSYDSFAQIRDTLGDFPGLPGGTNGCAQKVVLPEGSDPVPGYLGSCETYVSHCRVETVAATALRDLPGSSGAVVKEVPTGTIFTATGLCKTPEGTLWYVTQTGDGQTVYLYAGDTGLVEILTDDITITGATVPDVHVKGRVFYVKGDIASRYQTLNAVGVYIHSGFGVDGATVTGASADVTANAYCLAGSTIDKKTAFGTLPLGGCTYAVYADYTTHYASGSQVVTVSDRLYLIQEYFMVVSTAKDPAACAHAYGKTVLREATCTQPGEAVYGCGSCGDIYTQAIAVTPHPYVRQVIPGSCVAYEKERFTCSVCGDWYENVTGSTYADHVWENGICGVCEVTCSHCFRDNICVECGFQKPAVDYYLCGILNGSAYGCEEDGQNLGQYRFDQGSLTVTFTCDSYVAVKASDNVNYYMTQGQTEADTVTLYNTKSGISQPGRLCVPGGVEIRFTLTDNGDDTLTLSYTVLVPEIRLRGVSLSFEDEVFCNLYFDVENLDAAPEDMGLLVYDTFPQSVGSDTALERIPGARYSESQGYMVRTHGIPAKKLGDTLYLAVYARQSDGTMVYSDVLDYSARAYAMSRLEKSDNEKLKALCVSMLNYGAAAQTYFGYRTDALMNAELTDDQKALAAAYDPSFFRGAIAADSAKLGDFAPASGFSGKSASVSFEGAFAINYYLTPSESVHGDMTLYIWDSQTYAAASTLTTANATAAVTMTQNTDGSWWGQVSGIAAKALDDTWYVAGVYTDAQGNARCTGVIAYSLSRYCMNNANGTMGDLARATAMYGYHAKAYFTN